MKKIIKNYLPLILGVSLPIIIIIIFTLTQYFPRYFVSPPKYNLLFATNYYYYNNNNQNNSYEISVLNQKLVFKYQKLQYQRNKPNLYIFDPKNKNIKEIQYEIPQVTDDKWHIINIPELDSIQLDSNKTSLDGFSFKNYSSDNFNLFNLFLSSRYNRNYGISKNGYFININSSQDLNFYQVHFVGWIIS